MTVHNASRFALLSTLLVAQIGLTAASTVDPVAIVPGDRCYRCSRLLNDRFVAAEAIPAEADMAILKFRTVRCMLAYLKDTELAVEQLYVADDQTGALTKAETMVFVPVSIDAFTAETHYGIGDVDYVAFRSRSVAERFAARHGVQTMSWPAVMFHAQFLETRELEGDGEGSF